MNRSRILTVMVVVGCVSVALFIARAQSAPPVYVSNAYATYSFHNLKNPTGLFMSPSDTTHLYIADSGNNQVKAFASGATSLTLIAGSGTAGSLDGPLGSAEFNHPIGITGGGLIQIVRNGDHASFIALKVLDGPNKTIRYVCKIIQPFSGGGTPCSNSVTTVAGNTAGGFVDGTGTAARMQTLGQSTNYNSLDYFADTQNHAIRTFDSNYKVVTVAGNGTPGYVNGPKQSARFSGPTRITPDGAGNFYISDVGNFAIRKLDTANNVSTFAGMAVQGYRDGAGSQAMFAMPTSVVYNPSDHYVYVADALNNCIRRISSAGVVSTYAGTTTSGYVNGSLTAARFSSPTDLVISGTTMYISDTMNNSIRRIDMSTGVVSTLIN